MVGSVASHSIRPWLARESFRTRRPKRRIGAITSGTPSTTRAVSLGLVITSITNAPSMIRVFRSANEAEEPITTSRSPVSLVRREMASPARMVSKHPRELPDVAVGRALGDVVYQPRHLVQPFFESRNPVPYRQTGTGGEVHLAADIGGGDQLGAARAERRELVPLELLGQIRLQQG